MTDIDGMLHQVTAAYSTLTLRGGVGEPLTAAEAACEEAASGAAGAAFGLQHSERPAVSADSSGAMLSLRFLQRQQGWRLQPALVSRAALELEPICASVCPETAWEAAVAIVLLKGALRRQRCKACLRLLVAAESPPQALDAAGVRRELPVTQYHA